MPVKPILADFSPHLDLKGRRIAVDSESRRISVRVAAWDDVHSGYGQKVRMPRNVNVAAAHVGSADLADGSMIRVATLPMDTMHAPANMAALHAASWYENSGKGVARVRYSVDSEGIRADGVLFEDVSPATVDRLTAASASGDWRSAVAIKQYSDFERVPADFVGSCIVNVPGFSDTFGKLEGRKFALAASAHTIITWEDENMTHIDNNLVTADAITADAVTTASIPDNVVIDAVQAALVAGGEGDGCDGSCESCGCGAKPAAAAPAPVMATLSASALAALVESSDQAAVDAALEEARAALVASGAAEAPDPIAELQGEVAKLTSLVASMVFAQNDD